MVEHDDDDRPHLPRRGRLRRGLQHGAERDRDASRRWVAALALVLVPLTMVALGLGVVWIARRF
jgi:hypothetical protein